jgi:hypothetical protein
MLIELWGGPYDGLRADVHIDTREVAVHGYAGKLVCIYPDPTPANDMPANNITWYHRHAQRPTRFVYAQTAHA